MNTKEYNACVDQFADRVYRFVMKHCKNEADAQDLVQSAYEVLWKKRADIRFESARSFLFSVAYRQMIDQFRKSKRVDHVEEFDESARFGSQSSSDLKEVLNKALNTLPDIQKSVVLLRDYEGYAYKEIAKMVGLTESQVKVYIFRARKKLQSYLVSIDHII